MAEHRGMLYSRCQMHEGILARCHACLARLIFGSHTLSRCVYSMYGSMYTFNASPEIMEGGLCLLANAQSVCWGSFGVSGGQQ